MGASPNVSALCRELSLNRTQFNRYLAGESFPWPDILQKICLHFGLDARILLQPLSELKNDPSNAQAFYGLHEFLNMCLNICFPLDSMCFHATAFSIPTRSSKASCRCIARTV